MFNYCRMYKSPHKTNPHRGLTAEEIKNSKILPLRDNENAQP